MKKINLANAKKRNAILGFEAKPSRKKVFQVLKDGTQRHSVKILKSTMQTDISALSSQYKDLEALSDAIISEDVEIDFDRVNHVVVDVNAVNYGISYMVVYLDGGKIYEGNYTENLSIELREGIHEIIIAAFDLAGNKKVCYFYLKAINGIKVLGIIIDYGTLSFIISFTATILIFVAYKKRNKILKLWRWKAWKK